jgi:ABC-2 type transport system ATP-binding protein
MTELKEWAIGIEGEIGTIESLIENREVLFQKRIGSHSLYAVIKNDWTLQEQQDAYLSGVELSPIRSSDLFVYLTNEKKGGIDDVFAND